MRCGMICIRRCILATALFAVFAGQPIPADAQAQSDALSRPQDDSSTTEVPAEPNQPADTFGRAIHSGYLFIEGKYLPPPYVIRTVNDQVFVNDQPILADLLPAGHRERHHRRFGPSPLAMRTEHLAFALRGGNVVLSFEHQPLAILSRSVSGQELLVYLTCAPQPDTSFTLSELPPDFDHDLMVAWVASFEPTPELRRHAQSMFDEIAHAEEDSRRAIAAVRRNDTLLYLITVFGMVISVAATGHLLSAKPPTAKDFVPDDPDLVKMVGRSLGLVVVLSSLDLFWTIMASQSGKMIELNPIGSKLLHEPMQLIGAKAAIICCSVGLLYFLRHHRQAQTAAWWACLICTLLTFRWLTFNSMFV